MLYPDIIQKNVRHNFIFNALDGAFFGLGLGLASTTLVLPLFVSTLTDSAPLIGLVGSMHTIGWYLPQLFTANYVSKLRRYKPTVILLTIQERWPLLGLGIVALLLPTLGVNITLLLTLVLIVWYSLGGGITATAWQSMIGKIMPPNRIGTFFGAQAALASLTAAGGAVAAGYLLQALPSPGDFALCFLLAGISMGIAWIFIAQTREPENLPVKMETTNTRHMGWRSMADILRRDTNFRWFLIARLLSQLSWMAVVFLTIYGVRRFGMDEHTAGLMSGVLMLGQTVAHPLVGWLGDRWGHRRLLAGGGLASAGSALVAMAAPELGWLFAAFALAGLANATIWTTGMSMTLKFGRPEERALYIGLANTLIAPGALFGPIMGGWLADNMGFGATFLVAGLCGILTSLVLQFVVRDPHPDSKLPEAPAQMPSAYVEV